MRRFLLALLVGLSLVPSAFGARIAEYQLSGPVVIHSDSFTGTGPTFIDAYNANWVPANTGTTKPVVLNDQLSQALSPRALSSLWNVTIPDDQSASLIIPWDSHWQSSRAIGPKVRGTDSSNANGYLGGMSHAAGILWNGYFGAIPATVNHLHRITATTEGTNVRVNRWYAGRLIFSTVYTSGESPTYSGKAAIYSTTSSGTAIKVDDFLLTCPTRYPESVSGTNYLTTTSGSSSDFVIKNGPGAVAGSYSFDGASVLTTNSTITLTGELTVECYILPFSTSKQPICSSADGACSISLETDGTDSTLTIRKNSVDYDIVLDDAIPLYNRWTHIAVTEDSSQGIKVYVDGVLQTNTDTAADVDFVIDRFGYDGTTYYTGGLCEVYIYDSEEDATQIDLDRADGYEVPGSRTDVKVCGADLLYPASAGNSNWTISGAGDVKGSLLCSVSAEAYDTPVNGMYSCLSMADNSAGVPYYLAFLQRYKDNATSNKIAHNAYRSLLFGFTDSDSQAADNNIIQPYAAGATTDGLQITTTGTLSAARIVNGAYFTGEDVKCWTDEVIMPLGDTEYVDWQLPLDRVSLIIFFTDGDNLDTRHDQASAHINLCLQNFGIAIFDPATGDFDVISSAVDFDGYGEVSSDGFKYYDHVRDALHRNSNIGVKMIAPGVVRFTNNVEITENADISLYCQAYDVGDIRVAADILTTPSSTGDFEYSGLDFTPQAAIGFASPIASVDTEVITDNSAKAGGFFGIFRPDGVAAGQNEFSSVSWSEGTSTTNTGATASDDAFHMTNYQGSVIVDGTFTAFTPTGFTGNMTTTTALKWPMLFIGASDQGEEEPSAVPVIHFNDQIHRR